MKVSAATILAFGAASAPTAHAFSLISTTRSNVIATTWKATSIDNAPTTQPWAAPPQDEPETMSTAAAVSTPKNPTPNAIQSPTGGVAELCLGTALAAAAALAFMFTTASPANAAMTGAGRSSMGGSLSSPTRSYSRGYSLASGSGYGSGYYSRGYSSGYRSGYGSGHYSQAGYGGGVLSDLSLLNPANPISPLSPLNPLNLASPLNPINPISPLNPRNAVKSSTRPTDSTVEHERISGEETTTRRREPGIKLKDQPKKIVSEPKMKQEKQNNNKE